MGRPLSTVRFETAVVHYFIDAADLLGVPNSVAAIYGICFANAGPLSFSEIQVRLRISTGSISQGLRVLREIGALKVSTGYGPSTDTNTSAIRDGKRRDYYQPDLQLRKLLAHFIEQRLGRQLDSGRASLEAIVKGVPHDGPDGAILAARLKALQVWQEQAHGVLPLIRALLKLG